MQPRKFYLDTATRSFVAGVSQAFPPSVSPFFAEDVEDIELYFLRPTQNPDQPYESVDYSSNTVKFAVGLTAPAALQTAWTSISGTITAGITSVGGGNNEVQRLAFAGASPSTGAIFFTLPARAITVSSVTSGVFTAANHGLLDGQAVALSSFTISGSTFANSTYIVRDRTPSTFRITDTIGGSAINAVVTSGGGTATLGAISTELIPAASINAAAIQRAFVDAGISANGSPQILVSGSYASGFTISFTNTQGNINFDLLTVSSTLAGALGLSGTLSLNTTQVESLISAGTTSDLRLEVEVSAGGTRHTYATAANISSDIISSTSAAPLPTITPASSFNLIAPNSAVWNVTVDNDGVLTATKQ